MLTRRKNMLGSVSVAALLLVLRYWLSKDRGTKHVGIESTQDEYDYIVVGGGTAGCALAARLSENPNIRVLLIEAGGSGKELLFSRTPSAYGRLLYSKYCFPFRTEPQIHAKGQQRFWPRAKMLGGCSSINASMAQYGSPEDFDEWAEIIKDDSWAWTNFSKYFRKFENYTANPAYPEVDLAHRGNSGPVTVGYFSYLHPVANVFVKACEAVGIPFVADFNGEKGPLGVNRIMTYVDEKYRRVSAETAYLTAEVLARKNLTIAKHTTTTRVLIETVNGARRATGVEITPTTGGSRRTIHARKEVVLTAGAIHSPHILMLSGVGSASHLTEHNVPVVHDLPGVGQNLVDHPVFDLYFKDKTGTSLNVLQGELTLQKIFQFVKAYGQLLLGNGGPISTNLGESAAFVRSDDPKLFPPAEYPVHPLDTTSSKNSPDLELFVTPVAYTEHGLNMWKTMTFALHVYLLRPSSTGDIRLSSSDPFAHPIMNPNYLKAPEDLEKLVRGAKLCLKIANTKPLSGMVDVTSTDVTLDHSSHLKSDDEIRELVKERVETVYHPTSTCRMAPLDQGGVVDSELKVYGIEGLRVCDASIFPFILSGHTAGACYATAEKLADMLKKSFTQVPTK